MWLHQRYLLTIPMVGRNQCGCISPTFLGSPQWTEIIVAAKNLAFWGYLPRAGMNVAT